MKCPLCNGVGAMASVEFPEQNPPSPRKLDRNQRIVLQGINLLTTDFPELNGIHAEDLMEFASGCDENQITQDLALEIIVELVGMELVQLCSFGQSQANEWLPTVVCTEQGQLVAQQLSGEVADE